MNHPVGDPGGVEPAGVEPGLVSDDDKHDCRSHVRHMSPGNCRNDLAARYE